MTLSSALFSSATDQWETPQDLFDKLNSYYHFDLDVCALPHNAKCDRYFTPNDDGLRQDWNGICWMNPPYGNPLHACKLACTKKFCQERGYHIDTYRPGIGEWMEKAYMSSLKGATVVCLVPARTDTEWWHRYAMRGVITFLPGRLKFGKSKNSAPFPSAIVVFQPQGKAKTPSIK